MQPGLKQAAKVAKFASKNVAAYKTILKKNNRLTKLKSSADFFTLPILDKNKYIKKFSLEDLSPRSTLPAMLYASSGSSGQPTYWGRGDEQENLGAVLHEKIYREIFSLNPKDSTLVIICFSMGVWVAGGFTLSAFRQLTKKGYNLSCITPGIERPDIYHALEKLAPKFKNTILAGYPTFVMDIVRGAADKKIALPKNLKILTAGDSFSENFRSALLNKIGNNPESTNFIGLYGSADAGPMGFETPLTIFLRKEAEKNKKLFEELFTGQPATPALFQYLPEQIFFENINGELVLTAKTGIPLVRYNIHDLGRVIPYEILTDILENYGLLNAAKAHGLNSWKLPFVVKTGRSDVAVTFYALNILPEQIQSAIEHSPITNQVNGNYFAYHKMVKSETQEELGLILESKSKIKNSLLKKLPKIFAENLAELSLEFRKLYSALGKKALPKIKLVENGSLNKYIKQQHLGLLNLQGKKPKMIV